VARVALKGLRGQIGTALGRAQDPITVAHLQDCEREIDALLERKK